MINVNSRLVKQQVLEKQTALFIDSAVSGMEFTLYKKNMNGIISGVDINKTSSRIFIYFSDYKSSKGYRFFSESSIELEEQKDKFIIKVK